MSRILITGASGFLGKHVVKELKNDHDLFTPTSRKLNLLDATRLMCDCCLEDTAVDTIVSFLLNNKIDAIIHLAATCGGIGINKDNPGKFIYENLQMGINILEAARLAKVKKFINLGTVCSYPKFAPIPFVEETIWNGYPEETNAPYGIAKKTIMEMAIAYSRQYDMNVTNLVPVNMAGEWDNFDEYSSHVIPALINKFETSRDNNTVELWGTGSASREFLYAGDCARAIGIALEKNTGAQPINLGTGQEITICNLAELIKRIGGYNANIIWDKTKPDGQPRRCLDVTRAKNILRWEATTSLKELIGKTINWYRNE
jgi:GDP-L-fucose synthase